MAGLIVVVIMLVLLLGGPLGYLWYRDRGRHDDSATLVNPMQNRLDQEVRERTMGLSGRGYTPPDQIESQARFPRR